MIAEISTTLKSLTEHVVKALLDFEPGQSRTPLASPQPPELDTEQTKNLPAQFPAFSGIAGASYNKLPNPLSTIIQQLPVVDGLDVDRLMLFFKILFQLSGFPGMSDRTLLELVYPYCRGSMAERVAQTIRCGGSVTSFHQGVLDLSLIHI